MTQTIIGGDRGTHAGFIKNAKTSQYDWNSAPINDTCISWSSASIGKEFCFTLEVNIRALPSINTYNNSALFQYLRDVSTDYQFASSVFQVLAEERRTYHRERHNSTISATTSLKVGDILKSHVQVQSKRELVIVKNVRYQAKGPFIGTKDLHHNAFDIKIYNRPNSATRKYKSTELYLLPP